MAVDKAGSGRLLKALLEAGTAIGSSLDLDTLLEMTIDSACRVFRSGAASLLLIDQDTGTLHFKTATGEKREELARVRLKPGEGVAGWVAQTGKSLIVNDPKKDRRFYPELDERLRFTTETLMCVPLRIGGKVIGVLEVLNRLSGAYDEEDLAHLELLAEQVARAIQNARLYQGVRRESQDLSRQLDARYEPVGRSPAFKAALEVALKAASSKATILLRGESGTGKEVVARTIHRASQRADQPLVCVNCAAISETLLESELFGYEKGAFTGADKLKKGRFELAEGGTIFLDEIGNMSPGIQSKVLRVLQEREVDRVGGDRPIPVDVRVIAATNAPIEDLIRSSKFREDLYYRLNVITIELPPLRERVEDIPILVDHFIERFNRETKKNVRGISRKALDMLMHYRFPGNVRELSNLVERAVVLEDGELIQPERLPFAEGEGREEEGKAGESAGDGAFPSLDQVEKQHVFEALRRAKGVKTEACRLLGVSRPTLDRKIVRYKWPGPG